MGKKCILLLSSLFLNSCIQGESISSFIDNLSFETIGGTLFSSPRQVTLKEVHLDGGSLLGKEVIVEGQVIELNEHGTYLVLHDDTATMLIVLTQLVGSEYIRNKDNLSTKSGTLKILGTIESGKKGLPFVMARAVNQLPEPAQKG